MKVGEQKTEEQLAELAEKRREAGRRLQDQAAKSRAEKVLICFTAAPASHKTS